MRKQRIRVNCDSPNAVTGSHYPVGSKQSSSTGVTVGGAAQILQRDLGNTVRRSQTSLICIKGAVCKNWQPVEFILKINRGQHHQSNNWCAASSPDY